MGWKITAEVLDGIREGIDEFGRPLKRPLVDGAPELLTLVMFAHYADDKDGSVFVSLERIARETGLGYRTVKRAKDRLLHMGLLIHTGETMGRTKRVEKFKIADFEKWLKGGGPNRAAQAPLK